MDEPIEDPEVPAPAPTGSPEARRSKVKNILQAIGAGTPPAVAIRRSGMRARTFYDMLRRSPALDRAYELSRQSGAQVLADQGLVLAAHLSRKTDATPSQVMSMKLRLDYLRWYVGKLYPETFQDRLAGMGASNGPLSVVVVLDDRREHATVADAHRPLALPPGGEVEPGG